MNSWQNVNESIYFYKLLSPVASALGMVATGQKKFSSRFEAQMFGNTFMSSELPSRIKRRQFFLIIKF